MGFKLSNVIAKIKKMMWYAVLSLLTIIFIALITKHLNGHDETTTQATIESGHRVIIDRITNEVSGISTKVKIVKKTEDSHEEEKDGQGETNDSHDEAKGDHGEPEDNHEVAEHSPKEKDKLNPFATPSDHQEKNTEENNHAEEHAVAEPHDTDKEKHISPADKIAIITSKKQPSAELKKLQESFKFPIQAQGKAEVAVIVVGLGMSEFTTEKVFQFPEAVTLGFSSYSPKLREWVDKALRTNHTALLGIPMEPSDYPVNDPGPMALLSHFNYKKNIATLDSILERAKGFSGIYSPENEKFTFNLHNILPILKHLHKAKLGFVYGGSVENTSLLMNANFKVGLPTVAVSEIIDTRVSEEDIQAKLYAIEQEAMKNGQAIAIAHPYPITLRILHNWIEQLENKGITLVPISVMFDRLK